MELLWLITLGVTYFTYRILSSISYGSRDFLDIGLWTTMPVLLMLISVVTLFVFTDVLILLQDDNWDLFSNDDMFSRVVLSYLYFIFVFSFVYYFFSKRVFIQKRDSLDIVITSNYWIILFVIFFVSAHFIAGDLRGDQTVSGGWLGQLSNLLSRPYTIITPLVLALLVVNQTNRLNAFIFLLVTVVLYTLVQFYFVSSRGSVALMLMSMAMLDTLKWKGEFLSRSLFFLVLIGGAIFLAGLNALEAFIGGNPLFYLHFAQVFEYRPLLTTAEIFAALDTTEISFQYGQTWLDAFIGLLPSQIRPLDVESLAVFYMVKFHPEAWAAGSAAAFSAVAEGYMNFGYVGIGLEALIFAILCSLIRCFRYRGGLFGALVYASMLPLGYKIMRTDLSAIIHRIEWTLIITFILFFLLTAVKVITDRQLAK